eukprot:1366578-Amphidinium_carterae.2
MLVPTGLYTLSVREGSVHGFSRWPLPARLYRQRRHHQSPTHQSLPVKCGTILPTNHITGEVHDSNFCVSLRISRLASSIGSTVFRFKISTM